MVQYLWYNHTMNSVTVAYILGINSIVIWQHSKEQGGSFLDCSEKNSNLNY